ncbi:aminotransferase class V-fold PLP-dependent enzyme [Bacillus alkalicellulosilyticus]|uniref:aminotransferase class V-fold PLP-dependent enzyme n=1 Tax=Alkalihalobacterium alkalicellulosilyticum TaxID=1912214 RepID=UPI0009969D79
MDIIYFDQAASSFPKPKSVAISMAEAVNEYGANPGRGGHRLAVKASENIFATRKKIADMFGESDPNNVIFTQNATYALNQAIQGLPLTDGDHVITTSLEHNSVRRPLEFLKETKGISISYIKPRENGLLNSQDIKTEIKSNTVAIVTSHGSNVTGAVLPITEIGDIAKQHNLYFIVDASQTAGVIPINMETQHIDMLAFPGHKGLLGPQGTGVLIVNKRVPLMPLIYGGTGSHSEDISQPNERPYRFESGTLNTPAIVGLLAGIEEVEKLTIENIYAHELALTKHCLQELEKIDGVKIYGPSLKKERLGVISFTLEGMDVHEVSMVLDQHYHIAVRAGLHCSPLAHECTNTVSSGTIRVSFGPYNTIEEIDQFIQAVNEIKAYF